MEVYFAILDSKHVVELCRFRTSNHKLPIEIGRWNNTNRNNRMCTHCTKNELGDECHYILDSSFFEQDRNIYIPKYYYSRPIILEYKLLFSSKKKSVEEFMSYLRYLCLFVQSGVQRILCCVFALFFIFVLCTLCCQFFLDCPIVIAPSV